MNFYVFRSHITIIYKLTAWTLFSMNSWKKERDSIFSLKIYTEKGYIIYLRLPVNR
jgi:hypothetical protein